MIVVYVLHCLPSLTSKLFKTLNFKLVPILRQHIDCLFNFN